MRRRIPRETRDGCLLPLGVTAARQRAGTRRAERARPSERRHRHHRACARESWHCSSRVVVWAYRKLRRAYFVETLSRPASMTTQRGARARRRRMLAMSSTVHGVSFPWHRATLRRVSRARVGYRASSGFRAGASSSATSHAHEEKEAEDYRAHLYESVDLWSTSRRASLPGGGAEHNPETTPPRFTLSYMPMRNRAEVSRMILESTGCPYHFDVVGFKKWTDEVKPASVPEWRGDFGKLPVLTSHDAAHALPDGTPLRIGQETAITRFLARECGVAGDDAPRRRDWTRCSLFTSARCGITA